MENVFPFPNQKDNGFFNEEKNTIKIYNLKPYYPTYPIMITHLHTAKYIYILLNFYILLGCIVS